MNEKKRLVISTDCFPPRWDGVVRFLLEIIPRLKESYDITILAPDFGESMQIDGVRIIKFPIFKVQFGDFYFSKANKKKIYDAVSNADLVFNQSLGTIGIKTINAAKKLKKPVISYIHSIEWELATKSLGKFKTIINLCTKLIARHYYNKCDSLIAPSEEVKYIFKMNKILTHMKVVKLGTDINLFKPPLNKDEAKKAAGIDPLFKVIGFSGRIGREKNLITLYRAFRKLEKKHNDIKLLIVGKGITELEKEFSSSRNIITPGSTDNVVKYLQAMDIYVLPSLTETTSLSTMEAMACELAVITTPVGYVKEYIIEKDNGMFFPFKNSLVLSMKIEQLLADDKLRQTLGKRARKTIIDNFSWDNTVDGILNVLSDF